MHPAGSVILFTVASGLGFGLLAWLGIGQPQVTGWGAFFYFAFAYVLAVGGLISSTFHLGNPQRFLRAFSQWRCSWLSREGCMAVAALLSMAAYGFGLVFLQQNWMILGYIGAALSALTVFATAMIYAQLKTVPRWNQWSTPVLFLALSLGGGALLAAQLCAAAVLLIFASIVQIMAWVQGDRRFAGAGSTIGTATGLGARGTVRAFEPPHTGNNYLLKEMVHLVGRKHALKLRVFAIICMGALPLALLCISCSAAMIVVASIVHFIGVLTQRWLFFAEAEHVVGLYYGKR